MLVRRGNAKARLWSGCRGSGSCGEEAHSVWQSSALTHVRATLRRGPGVSLAGVRRVNRLRGAFDAHNRMKSWWNPEASRFECAVEPSLTVAEACVLTESDLGRLRKSS